MKHFRINKIDVSKLNENNPYVLRYRIEQRHTFMFFFHYWSSPMFAPPHMFHSVTQAICAITEKYPNANIDYNY